MRLRPLTIRCTTRVPAGLHRKGKRGRQACDARVSHIESVGGCVSNCVRAHIVYDEPQAVLKARVSASSRLIDSTSKV
jgi:hypothetical protein